MGLDYSYTQPSSSEDYGCNIVSSGYSETEALIQQDQAQLSETEALILQEEAQPSYTNREVHYPPQPEVEFGFPQVCYCGAQPQLATSKSINDPGRRYYTCANADDGECHVWKWWDMAVMEEMRARDSHTLQLAEKVDFLTGFNDYGTHLNPTLSLRNETEEKLVKVEKLLCELVDNSSRNGSDRFAFEYFVGLTVMVLVLIGLVVVTL